MTDSPSAAPTPARHALLAAEVRRLGLSGEAAARALTHLIAASSIAPADEATNGPRLVADATAGTVAPTAPRHLRWGHHTLPLGERTLIMGVLNVTDNSLSGDGLGDDLSAVLAHAKALVAAGADTLDVGGESRRP